MATQQADVSQDVLPVLGADPDDRRIGRRDGDVADRGDRLIVEDRLPRDPAVHGLRAGGPRRVELDFSFSGLKTAVRQEAEREARIRRIGEGPSEVHRMVIARSLLR